MTTIDSRYDGGLRCSASHGPSGSLLETDAPTDNQGQGERFSPTDLVATARVNKTMTAEAPRRIALLEVWITLPAGLSAQQRGVLQRAGETCPVKLSLEGAVPMQLHWS